MRGKVRQGMRGYYLATARDRTRAYLEGDFAVPRFTPSRTRNARNHLAVIARERVGNVIAVALRPGSLRAPVDPSSHGPSVPLTTLDEACAAFDLRQRAVRPFVIRTRGLPLRTREACARRAAWNACRASAIFWSQ
jgi:hypothetical protein